MFLCPFYCHRYHPPTVWGWDHQAGPSPKESVRSKAVTFELHPWHATSPNHLKPPTRPVPSPSSDNVPHRALTITPLKIYTHNKQAAVNQSDRHASLHHSSLPWMWKEEYEVHAQKWKSEVKGEIAKEREIEWKRAHSPYPRLCGCISMLIEMKKAFVNEWTCMYTVSMCVFMFVSVCVCLYLCSHSGFLWEQHRHPQLPSHGTCGHTFSAEKGRGVKGQRSKRKARWEHRLLSCKLLH